MISAEEDAALTADQCIDLMFLAGLSTGDQATEFSGRSVELDIVKTKIQRVVNRRIDVESRARVGTRFVISLTFTLAIVLALLVSVQQFTFAVPIIMIMETLRLTGKDIKHVNLKLVTLLRGKVLPRIAPSDVFKLSQAYEKKNKYLFAVVIQLGFL